MTESEMQELTTAHTPGPWTYQRSKAPVDGEYDFAISAAGAPVIAEAFGRTADGGYPPAEANARLLHAAPDLLAQLKHAVHWHDQITPADVARYQAAIDKAEGR